MVKRKIELLAPAKNIECGMAAIEHGADAVYIGAEHFGARVAAGNSIEDIKRLCAFAHTFRAKVYVTVNTIIYDEELDSVRKLIDSLAEAGVDAVIAQDMALVEMLKEYPEKEMHASTQTDNRNVEKVEWLKDMGFSRVVLARELTLEEIRSIHQKVPDVELEVFVHGALCVSYSGACYASQYCFRRSANRGACAQFCRLGFDLVDAEGNELLHDRHLLSLRDLSLADELEPLMEAGATSFKIEGRLKDVNYVKNVVSAYSRRIDNIISRNRDKYERASDGTVEYSFTPDLKKTFNRGFTHYFLQGRPSQLASFDTPKAMGEYVGNVKETRGRSFNVTGTSTFANGDGLCFINKERKLEGFRVNKAENNRLFVTQIPKGLTPGTALYRNSDKAFEKILAGRTAERKIGISLRLDTCDNGLTLTVDDGLGCKIEKILHTELQKALKPQRENIIRQLEKLGDTPYKAEKITVGKSAADCFVPSSRLADLRREAIENLSESRLRLFEQERRNGRKPIQHQSSSNTDAELLHTANVANREARAFYAANQIVDAPQAYETSTTDNNRSTPLMTCRYCLRHELGYCVKHGGRRPTWKEPLCLRLPDGRRFRLSFDCKNCQMKIYANN